jgi:two-component system, NarL family, invasion response regulator UvrY
MIRVLLVDDHELVRDGIRHLLEEASDIQVAGQAANGSEAIREYKRALPDVVLLDISMPVMDGLDACKQLKAQHPEAKILILTVHPEEQYAMRLLNAGALGYLTKRVSALELQKAVREVAQGHISVPEASKSVIMAQMFQTKGNLQGALADREVQVFNLLAQGKKLREIAQDLSISLKTVENYRYRILTKLNLNRTVDLVAFAYRHNLV